MLVLARIHLILVRIRTRLLMRSIIHMVILARPLVVILMLLLDLTHLLSD